MEMRDPRTSGRVDLALRVPQDSAQPSTVANRAQGGEGTAVAGVGGLLPNGSRHAGHLSYGVAPGVRHLGQPHPAPRPGTPAASVLRDPCRQLARFLECRVSGQCRREVRGRVGGDGGGEVRVPCGVQSVPQKEGGEGEGRAFVVGTSAQPAAQHLFPRPPERTGGAGGRCAVAQAGGDSARHQQCQQGQAGQRPRAAARDRLGGRVDLPRF